MAGDDWVQQEARRLCGCAFCRSDKPLRERPIVAAGCEADRYEEILADGFRAGLDRAAKLCGERASTNRVLLVDLRRTCDSFDRVDAAFDEAEACELAIRALMGGA